MIKIFAKHGTDEKTLVVCPREHVGSVQSMLNKKDGGNWLLVEDLQPNEVLRFKDGLKYHGFHGKDERYCNGIEKLT